MKAQTFANRESPAQGSVRTGQSWAAQNVEARIPVLVKSGDGERPSRVGRVEIGVEPVPVGTLIGGERSVGDTVGKLIAAIVQAVDRQLRCEGIPGLNGDYGTGAPILYYRVKPAGPRARSGPSALERQIVGEAVNTSRSPEASWEL